MSQATQNQKAKIYNFEIYTCNPITKEEGWDIKFVTVVADSKMEAREKLKDVPNFDVVILFDYSMEVTIDDSFTTASNGTQYRFESGYRS